IHDAGRLAYGVGPGSECHDAAIFPSSRTGDLERIHNTKVVAAAADWRHRLGVNKSPRRGKVRHDERANGAADWALFPGPIVYVWHGALHAATVAESLTTQGFTIGAQIIWAKERLVIGRSDYHWQHEPMLVRRAIQGQLD